MEWLFHIHIDSLFYGLLNSLAHSLIPKLGQYRIVSGEVVGLDDIEGFPKATREG